MKIFKKKELLIIFILAVLVTGVSGFVGFDRWFWPNLILDFFFWLLILVGGWWVLKRIKK